MGCWHKNNISHILYDIPHFQAMHFQVLVPSYSEVQGRKTPRSLDHIFIQTRTYMSLCIQGQQWRIKYNFNI